MSKCGYGKYLTATIRSKATCVVTCSSPSKGSWTSAAIVGCAIAEDSRFVVNEHILTLVHARVRAKLLRAKRPRRHGVKSNRLDGLDQDYFEDSWLTRIENRDLLGQALPQR